MFSRFVTLCGARSEFPDKPLRYVQFYLQSGFFEKTFKDNKIQYVNTLAYSN